MVEERRFSDLIVNIQGIIVMSDVLFTSSG